MSLPDQLAAPVTAHEPHRFVALDALRSAAAFAVVGFHVSINAVPHGYLAVDFFFLLSGFVVAFAYQTKLDSGKVSSFALARVIRLYPLYLSGLFLGVALALIKHMLHFPLQSFKSIGIAAIFGLFILPTPRIAEGISVLFPLNSPAWSLFDEILANACHALFFRRRGMLALYGTIGLSGLALLYAALTRRYLEDGARQSTALWGMVRCTFGYSMGMCLCVLWRKGLATRAMPFAVTLLLLVGSFFVPHSMPRNALFDLLMIVAAYPCLLWFSIGTTMHRSIQPIFRVLAESSYAIYMIHMPLLGILALAWNRLSRHRATPVWIEIVFVIAIAGTAIAADYFYDRPIRQALGGIRDRSQNPQKTAIRKTT